MQCINFRKTKNYFFEFFRLEAGKFDENLLQSIRSARNFILVLTEGALDRCINDIEEKDWVQKEVICALNSNCNIIPVFDNFVMPKSEDLPLKMRPLLSYNGVNWIHEYQKACVDKIERFLETFLEPEDFSADNSRKNENSVNQGT